MKTVLIFILGMIPTLLGFFDGEKKRKNANEVGAFLDFLDFVKTQVELYLIPQNEIFLSYKNKALFDSGFLEKLQKRAERNELNAFFITVNEFIPEFQFGKAEEECVLSFAENFGALPLLRQLEECDKVIKAVRLEEEKKKKDLTEKIKLSRTIGLSIGIGIVIILM